ncbi:uncharacterized protein N7496_002923 [Penicillium cataractarum]|uniref:Restriction endonuclease type IV Mrr domain-containing protein n=1 Tax=Penicillium cataractarum TaxID=2100454 RepID=A0A9W9SLB2_9EURO|nr:uncharacterized protein N7496_002923 [Penicillium cataractarum]KAJ5380495.1 hypothetical protein N7496_002923 [Penicillium cataractarum]
MRRLHLHHGLAARDLSTKSIRSARPCRRCFSRSRTDHDLTPFTRRIFKLPSAPSPPSQQHDDLTSFLSYAERISLPQTSTVYVGTHYEYTVLQSLRHYALALHRIGGRDDAGIDLVGTWHLPERERERALRVLVQCKALKTKLGPNLVRELEGAIRQAPVGWRTGQTAGVLVSPREATKGVRDALARSSYPLFWMMVELDGTLKQALWNARAEELGLGPLGVETRYGAGAVDAESGSVRKEVALTWDGGDIPDMDLVEQSLLRHEDQWVKSWGVDWSKVDKEALLDVVERIFPDGQPEPQPDGSLSAVDQSKVLAALREK